MLKSAKPPSEVNPDVVPTGSTVRKGKTAAGVDIRGVVGTDGIPTGSVSSSGTRRRTLETLATSENAGITGSRVSDLDEDIASGGCSSAGLRSSSEKGKRGKRGGGGGGGGEHFSVNTDSLPAKPIGALTPVRSSLDVIRDSLETPKSSPQRNYSTETKQAGVNYDTRKESPQNDTRQKVDDTSVRAVKDLPANSSNSRSNSNGYSNSSDTHIDALAAEHEERRRQALSFS